MKISVVMTTYNGEKYLKQQIDSILCQTLLPDEIIICDDCSTDNTVAILEQYREVKGLRFVVNDRQLGLIQNFKKAVSLADSSNCIALCDQDDIWLPHKLFLSAKMLGSFDNSLPCMVHSDLILIDEQENILNPSFQNELGQSGFVHNLQTLLYGNFVTGCTILMNPKLSAFFEKMPIDIKFHDSWIALAASTFGMTGEIADPTIKYRKHSNNLSIAANTKPRNRYRSILNELMKSVIGKDDFLELQFQTARRFHEEYKAQMDPEKARWFKAFLALEHSSYFFKKLAFRKVVRRFKK